MELALACTRQHGWSQAAVLKARIPILERCELPDLARMLRVVLCCLLGNSREMLHERTKPSLTSTLSRHFVISLLMGQSDSLFVAGSAVRLAEREGFEPSVEL